MAKTQERVVPPPVKREHKPSLITALLKYQIIFVAILVLFLPSYLIHNVLVDYQVHVQEAALVSKGAWNIPVRIPEPVVAYTNKGVDFLNVKIREVLKSNYQLPKAQAHNGVIPVRYQDIPVIAVLLSFLFAYIVTAQISHFGRLYNFGKLDNDHPRAATQRLQNGFGVRAAGAHQNAVEGFAPFAIAVVLNLVFLGFPKGITTANAAQWALLIKECGIVVVARLLHSLLYYLNLSTLRTVTWLIITISLVNLYVNVIGQ